MGKRIIFVGLNAYICLNFLNLEPMKKFFSGILCLFLLSSYVNAQNQACADSSAFYTFQYNAKNYTIVKDGKNWADALLCAYELGGHLAIIDSQEEQDAIWTGIQNANITNSNTVAPDGGNASYLWIGGNDLVEEGNWVWIDENGSTTQFWQGISTGNSVDGLYNNWGDEPDDYLGQQDGLGLALTDWPLGFAGEWNDLNVANLLYYIIEFEGDSASEDSVIAIASHSLLLSTIYPNPSSSYFKISGNDVKEVIILNALGQQVYHKVASTKTININHLQDGIYFVKMITDDNNYLIRKLKVIK